MKNLKIGDTITGKISDEEITGQIIRFSSHHGQDVVDIQLPDLSVRFLYENQIL
jgi:hypothetical protein